MSIKSILKRSVKYILHGIPNKITYAQISYLSPNERLKGKKIIITGGGRGLGFAMAQRFANEGALVLIAGRNEKTLKEKSEILSCKYLQIDMEDVTSLPVFLRKAEQILEGIDCIVCNAGISLHEGNIRNVTVEQFNAQINTNLRGSYFLAQCFIKILEEKKQKNGNILFVSSERGIYVDDLPYGLTKAAINSLTQGLANRVINSEIRVNAIAPGVTASDMTGFNSENNLFCNFNITERVYLPEEVAETACFLLSDVSRCLSGQILVCNEGKSINAHWR